MTVDEHLKFDVHINNIVAHANRLSNLIHKCFVSKDPTTLMLAFKTYVRPLLEYASCMWSPHHIGLIRKIESVQWKFTKHLHNCRNLNYGAWLVKHGVDSLELRRLRFDLIYIYKVLFGLVDIDSDALFVLNKTDATHGQVTHPQSWIDNRHVQVLLFS